MDINSAKKIVENQLREYEDKGNSFGSGLPGYVNPEIELVIVDELTQEHEFGWVFCYNSKKYLEGASLKNTLLGNAPIIVDRNSGQFFITGTARGLNYYVENFKKTGNPHKEKND